MNITALSLYDVTGKKVFEETGISAMDGRFIIQMDVLEDGYYFVNLEGEDGTRTVLPVVLQR